MENKLGISYYKLQEVEKKLINLKLNLLDETYNFNCDLFTFEYLVRLNKYLFEDIYDLTEKQLITINEIEFEYLNELMKNIKLSIEKENINSLIENIESIWCYQPFIIGNTRTMIAYLQVLKKIYFLDISLDVNSKIESNPRIFKTLTKKG